MKKGKILFCCLVAGLSVAAGLLCNEKNTANELMLLNVEALSQSESVVPDCVPLHGMCIKDKIFFGMALAN